MKQLYGSTLHTDMLWHIDPLLSNDRDISNYTTAILGSDP